MFSFLLHKAKIYGFISYEIKQKKNKLRVGYTTSDVKSVTHQKSISQAGITCVTMFGRTLWKGPRICSPAYDLKFRLTKCVIIRRGAPGSLVIAGGGGGGMLPTISSKLLLSTVSVASPWDESVAHKKYNFYSSVRVVSGGGGSCTWGRGREAYSRTHTQKKQKQTKHTHQVTRAVKVRLQKEKLTGVIFLCSANKSQPQKERDHGRLWTNPHYNPNALHQKRLYVLRCATLSMTNN